MVQRRVIRKMERPAAQTLDERLWPVNVALAVLASFLLGLVVAYRDFADPVWYRNAWFWLAFIPLTTLGAMVVLRMVDNRTVRRGVQFAAVLSLLVHIIFLVWSLEATLFGKRLHVDAALRKPALEKPRVVLPEYAEHHFQMPQERPRQDYERPVETETPDAPTPETTRQQTQPEPPTPERPPVETPEIEPRQTTSAVARQQSGETAPRASEESSKWSRRTAAATATPNQTAEIPTPSAPQPTTAPRTEPTPETRSVTRQTTERSQTRSAPNAEAAAPLERAIAGMTRRSAEPTAQPETATAPMLPRQSSEPRATPRSAVAADSPPAPTRQTSPDAPQPAATATTRRDASEPVAARQPLVDIPPTPAPTPSPTPQRQLAAPAQPTIAAAPTPVPNQRARLTTRPDVSTAAPTAAAQPVPLVGAATPTAAANTAATAGPSAASLAARKQATASPEVARAAGEPTPATGLRSPTPTAVANAVRTGAAADVPQAASANSPTAAAGRQRANTPANIVTSAANVAANTAPQAASEVQASTTSQVARQTTGASNAARVQTPLDAPAASTSSQVASTPAQRAAESAVPSLDPTAPAASAPARAAQAAAAAASPANVESPATSVAPQGTGEPAAQPQPTAVARAQRGMAGAGESPNLDRSAPAANSPALVASGAAQRSQATQNTPEGPALAPSEAAVVRRSVAGAARPSASLQADAAPTATEAGAARPTDIAVSASATVTSARSNAAPGAVNAAAGRVEVDAGPTQVVAEQGTGRASGGGQPDASTAPESAVIARSRTGGSPRMAIAATDSAVQPVAPATTGGGAPAAQPLTAQATATVRNAPGGEAPVTGGPTAAAAPGATVEASAAPLAAETARSRADASGGEAGAAAGGQPDALDEDEEEKKRRVARAAAGGAPRIDAGATSVAESPAAAAPTPNSGGAPVSDLTATPLAAAMTRSGPSGESRANPPTGGAANGAGEPAAGAPAAEVSAATPAVRAEATEAVAGAPALGGGTAAPARSAAGPTLPSDAQAEMLDVVGQPSSSGSAQGLPVEAQALAASRNVGGVRGATNSEPAGAMTGEVPVEASTPGMTGAAAGRRQSTAGAADAPTAASLESGGPVRRSDSGAAGSISVATVEVPEFGAEVDQANEDHLSAAAAKGVKKTQTGGGPLAVDIAALEGPGGLGSEATADVGIVDRRAREDNLEVRPNAARFKRQNVGGLPSVSSTAVASTESFRGRASRTPGTGGRNGSPPPRTEEAIELGLAFLARYQAPDGRWSLSGFNEEVALSSDTAATGLALLAFQGAGYNHREHKYQEVVRAALDHLLKGQRDDGDLFVSADDESNRSVWLYSHSIAALAVCEAYGMTQDPALKEPAQKSLDFIIAAQHKQRGGWRYSPGVGADTSVSGWMLMALKSGELAGLKVPPETFVGIQRWLDSAQASTAERHLYRYNPLAPDTESQRHGRQPTRTMTSVGLLMRLYTGWNRDNSEMIRGADYLLQAPPAHGTARNLERDTYYWYYATQVMFHVGGERWERWNGKLHPLLVESQVRQGPYAGSWDPLNPVPDRWAPHAGRLYVTTLNLLSLEVYYRHLPLYGETGR